VITAPSTTWVEWSRMLVEMKDLINIANDVDREPEDVFQLSDLRIDA
jgi:hypothetical protein